MRRSGFLAKDFAPAGRLLLVEDEAVLARLLVRCFERLGCRTTWLATIAEAARSVEIFDCGIFDVDLGDGCGVELAEQLLSSGRVRHVVFYSGTLDRMRRQRAQALGPFVNKPAPFEQIREAVFSQLDLDDSASGAYPCVERQREGHATRIRRT